MATQRRSANDGIMAVHSLHTKEPVSWRQLKVKLPLN